MRHPSVLRATRELQPEQQSLAPAGTEKIGHTMQAAYLANHCIISEDGINAFGCIDRQRIFDAVQKRWPEGATIVNAYYSTPSFAVFMYDDDDGQLTARIISNEEGLRQGCVKASFLFNITGHDIYKPFTSEFPKDITRAIMDDMPMAIAPPDDITDMDA